MIGTQANKELKSNIRKKPAPDLRLALGALDSSLVRHTLSSNVNQASNSGALLKVLQGRLIIILVQIRMARELSDFVS